MVVEVKRGEESQLVLNHLYKHTQMQESFGMILLAIAGGQPRELGLVEFLRLFLEHRRDVVLRRTRFDLRKAEEREHILLGFQKALDHLDEIIKLIRRSKSPKEAKEGLMERWEFSDRQAQAILDLQLHRLTQMEREKILEELKQIQARIAELKEILASEKRLKQVIVGELREVQKDYGDDRRTQIVDAVEEIKVEDLIPDTDMAITISHAGYIKRTSVDIYRHQSRGGKGTHRRQDAGRGFRRASVHRLGAQLHPALQLERARVLAEGVRNSRGSRRDARQGHRQPDPLPGRRAPDRARTRTQSRGSRQVRLLRHAQRHGEEN